MFCETVIAFKFLTILAKSSIVDVGLGSGCNSAVLSMHIYYEKRGASQDRTRDYEMFLKWEGPGADIL